MKHRPGPDAESATVPSAPPGRGRGMARARRWRPPHRVRLADILAASLAAGAPSRQEATDDPTMGAGLRAASARRHGEARSRAADRKSAGIDAARSRPGSYAASTERLAS